MGKLTPQTGNANKKTVLLNIYLFKTWYVCHWMNINKHRAGLCWYFWSVLHLFLWSHLGFLWWYKVVPQRLHGKLHSVPQFVTEVTVTQDAVDIQIDIPTWETNTGKHAHFTMYSNRFVTIDLVATRLYCWVFSQCFDLFYIQAAGQWRHNKRREEKKNKKKTNEFTLASVGTQGEPESICAALWDAIWVVWLLALLCLLHLQWIQVAVRQLGM